MTPRLRNIRATVVARRYYFHRPRLSAPSLPKILSRTYCEQRESVGNQERVSTRCKLSVERISPHPGVRHAIRVLHTCRERSRDPPFGTNEYLGPYYKHKKKRYFKELGKIIKFIPVY